MPLALAVIAILVLSLFAATHRPAIAQGSTPNIVVILTDDQRYDTLKYMPKVRKHLVNEGVNFKNAVASTPLCCPARASFLSGGLYPFETNVKTNGQPNGGAQAFNDMQNTLAINLQGAGYTTAMIGKYLNHYERVEIDRVPPGWSHWQAIAENSISMYFDFRVARGSSTPDAEGATEVRTLNDTLSTTWINREAYKFIMRQDSDNPFFLLLSYSAPHEPAESADIDKNDYNGFAFTNPGTLEADLSDKPSWVQNYELEADPALPGKQIESLKSVDRGVDRIIRTLEQKNSLDNTMVVFVSDNGVMWGEHGGLKSKNMPYQESLKVPLIIRMPGGLQDSDDRNIVAWNLDLAATVYDLAGIEDMPTSGMSLVPLLTGEPVDWREDIVIQGYSDSDPDPDVPHFIGIYSKRWKYIEYPTGEREMYNIIKDDYELQNEANNPTYARALSIYENRLDELKDYVGLAILNERRLPDATIGEPYHVELQTWGGKEPLTFTLQYPNRVPEGLTINGSIISGVPTGTQYYGKNIPITVRDSSVLPVYGQPQEFTVVFRIYLSS